MLSQICAVLLYIVDTGRRLFMKTSFVIVVVVVRYMCIYIYIYIYIHIICTVWLIW